MVENPYEPPQSPPEPRPSRKAQTSLLILSMLSVPASAIAGSTLCTSLSMSTSIGPLAWPVGIAACLAIVVGALALEQRATSPFTWRQFQAVLGAVAKAQTKAFLLVLLTGCLTSSIVTVFLLRGNGQNAWLVLLAYGSVLNLAWSLAAYFAWRNWFRQHEKGENPFRPRD